MNVRFLNNRKSSNGSSVRNSTNTNAINKTADALVIHSVSTDFHGNIAPGALPPIVTQISNREIPLESNTSPSTSRRKRRYSCGGKCRRVCSMMNATIATGNAI